ncbi:MAG: glycosyltransferase family 4 protein [Rhodospirillales bacterium]|nr:glycosyltransferase family 4 protein [Rhodospirillales bacterium]
MSRIAVVTDRRPPSWGGGVATAHFHCARLLSSCGHDVKVFATFDPLGDSEDVVRRTASDRYLKFLRRANSAIFRILDPGRLAYQLMDIAQRAPGSRKVAAVLARFDPDVVILPDHGAPGLWLPKLPRAKKVMIAHHNPSRFALMPGMAPLSGRDIALAMWLEDRVLRSIDLVICPSHYMAGVFRETHRFHGPIEVIPNLVDPAFHASVPADDPRQGLGLAPDDPLIFVPAGGNRFKGADYLPRIAERLNSYGRAFGLFVSGHVPDVLRRELPWQIPVFAPGVQSGEGVLSALKACSFGIYPTLVENYSMALLEAALSGVPMLTFDVGGNSEIILDGVNGRLVPAYDVEALMRAAEDLLRDSARLLSLQGTTLRDAKSRLAAEHHLARFERAITQ